MSIRSRNGELREPLLSNYDGEDPQQPEHIQIRQFQPSASPVVVTPDVNIINLPHDDNGDDDSDVDDVDGADFHYIHGPNTKKTTEDDKPKVRRLQLLFFKYSYLHILFIIYLYIFRHTNAFYNKMFSCHLQL